MSLTSSMVLVPRVKCVDATGDPVPESIMQKLIPTKQQAAEKTLVDKATDTASVGATMGPWLIKHREAVSLPLIQKFVTHIRSSTSPSKLGAVGFCWGGRYAILLTHEGADPYVDAAVANHPSFLSMPTEIEKISRPVDIEVGDSDDIMKMPDVEKTKEIFKGKEGCEIEVYEDQVHGFTVRGDLSIEKDKKAKEKATEKVCLFLR
jgi:dienelactone hydrolase